MGFKKSISINFNQFFGDMFVVSMSKMGKKVLYPNLNFVEK